jgi:hypothetical protein
VSGVGHTRPNSVSEQDIVQYLIRHSNVQALTKGEVIFKERAGQKGIGRLTSKALQHSPLTCQKHAIS